jgi:predicted amidohydrolase
MAVYRSLAAAQTTPRRGDVAANILQHERLMLAAAEADARTLVFPELSLTGYELDIADHLAFSEDDDRLLSLRELAAELQMTVIVGAPARIDSGLHIAAFILSPDRLLDLYTKQRLGAFPADANSGGDVPPPEATVFQPCQRNPLLYVGGQPAAIAICADLGDTGHPKSAADRGAKTYLASTFVIPADLEADVARLRNYARAYSMTIVFANFGGPSGQLASAGCSAIVTSTGELLAQLPPTGAGLSIAIETETGWRPESILIESMNGLP